MRVGKVLAARFVLSGEPVGGKSVMTAIAELRLPMFKRVGGAVFLEAGNVWQDPWTMRLGDLRYDAGPGVRFDTPTRAAQPSTARCLILVTPDAQRTMNTFLGAAQNLTA